MKRKRAKEGEREKKRGREERGVVIMCGAVEKPHTIIMSTEIVCSPSYKGCATPLTQTFII